MPVNLLFLNEALWLVSSTTIQGVFWGINLSLYFLCTRLFYRRYRKASDEPTKLLLSFVCNSVMVVMAGLELGSVTRGMQLAFINHGGVDGEPEEFILSIPYTSALSLLNIIPSFVIPVLNSVVQSWRVWVIWEMSPYKLVVSILLWVILIIAEVAIEVYYLTLSRGNITPGNLKLLHILGTAQVAGNLLFNLLVTFLLVGRIIVVRRRHNRLMGTSSDNDKQYTNIVAMLIESYALDSFWATLGMITYALSSAGIPVRADFIFVDAGDQVTVMAFLLVSYRVLLSRAWIPETERQLSTIRWNNHGPETISTEQATSIAIGPSHVKLRSGENTLLV